MFSFFNSIFGSTLPPKEEEHTRPRRKKNEPSCPRQTYPPRKRMQHNLGEEVMGFPSSGGMLRKRCTMVELAYLDLYTVNKDIPTSEDPTEEDAFCQKLRMLGAVLWPSMGYWVEADMFHGKRTEAEKVELEVGWPEDGRGVWISRWKNDQESYWRFAKLDKARTMDERCQIIEEMGGRFYEDPKDCPELGSFL